MNKVKALYPHGQGIKLIYRNGSPSQEVKVGDHVTTNRGESGVVESIQAPTKPTNSGSVHVLLADQFAHKFLPSVIGAQWVNRGVPGVPPVERRK